MSKRKSADKKPNAPRTEVEVLSCDLSFKEFIDTHSLYGEDVEEIRRRYALQYNNSIYPEFINLKIDEGVYLYFLELYNHETDIKNKIETYSSGLNILTRQAKERERLRYVGKAMKSESVYAYWDTCTPEYIKNANKILEHIVNNNK